MRLKIKSESLTFFATIPMMASPMSTNRLQSLLRAIVTDVHFWIPLVVLAGGFLLLDKLS